MEEKRGWDLWCSELGVLSLGKIGPSPSPFPLSAVNAFTVTIRR